MARDDFTIAIGKREDRVYPGDHAFDRAPVSNIDEPD
jgi:hypothetical protein